MREHQIRCDEFDKPALVLLLPAGDDWVRAMSRARQLKVQGLKAPVRIWLRPAHAVEGLLERFYRRMVTAAEGEFMRRSELAAAWNVWFERHGQNINAPSLPKLHRCFFERFGVPVKRQGHYGWPGYALPKGKKG